MDSDSATPPVYMVYYWKVLKEPKLLLDNYFFQSQSDETEL